ncbi:MAG TPA: hypothetical protein VFT29_17950, partial [Gemmatimonadaceae bacterium]|nr:hypothetical protein [Gemmatimonadaceae bacterium]
MAGERHGDLLSDTLSDEIPGSRAAEVVRDPSESSCLARALPRIPEAADLLALVVEQPRHQLARAPLNFVRVPALLLDDGRQFGTRTEWKVSRVTVLRLAVFQPDDAHSFVNMTPLSAQDLAAPPSSPVHEDD